ncbi:cysteine-rich receptor-like protein kinase 10 [Cryptomeria japonica]|uniref:cysteine-rich receptor-like protein kinase 10 n=1 Tax=Cryptomeria japonica TaxID=3369 RepID=UPI0027D9FDA7|nr:cysteine-rich receptor-like protein kinase 10 [Cryptomeria japonica]
MAALDGSRSGAGEKSKVTNVEYSVISTYIWHTCDNSSTFTDGSTYSTNLDLVINDLFLNAPQSSGFNTSSHGQSPNKVYGLLQCTGNISSVRCSNCAVEANNNTDGIILRNRNNIAGEAFKSTTSSHLSNLSNKAYIPANKGFAAGLASYSASGIEYGLVQCWQDISIQDCRLCLIKARTDVNSCCSSNQGAQAQYGSCKSPSPSPDGSTTNTSTPPATSTPSPAVTPSPPAVAPSLDTVNGTSSTTSKGKSSETLPIVLSLVGGIILTLALCLTVLRKRVKSVIYGRPTTANADNQGVS